MKNSSARPAFDTRSFITYSAIGLRQITPKDYVNFDLLIGMDEENIRNMRRVFSGDPEGKISLLLDHAGRGGNVADPWYTGDFEATWRDVNDGCRALLRELS